MNIKKQIILDDKDYERLVHDANLSNDEIKSKIASALTTDIVVSFDFDVNKKVTGNMRIESATHNLGYNEYDNIVRARDENIHHAVYTAIYDYLEKIKRDNNELSAKDWILFTSTTLDSITTSYGLYSSNVGISISDHGSILTVWMYMLW